jgi:hypothetical protein
MFLSEPALEVTMPQHFDPSAYGPAVAALLAADRVAPLGPGTPNRAVRPALAALTAEAILAPHPIRDGDMARACLAGLWLYHDFLDESHTISQDVATTTGSYWHAVMHRREPDAGNSKYWWRRVGAHPVLGQLRERSPEVGYRFTSPEEFVDFCERVRGTGGADEGAAERVQRREWELLFAWCHERARG